MGSYYQAGGQIDQYQAGLNSLKNRNNNDRRDQEHLNVCKNEWASINIVQPKSGVSCDGALDPVPTREQIPASLTTYYSC